ncbi:DUF72 domain-containing protein [Dehalogenimonas etheniformans]|uniref:DUF72 domain-containing protein n=1 Tax=Dehalogenimonas etheniformans TaxID=1536648 RepID=A0A2P5P5S7_9CHLR|nr:DUF72 domain-containing protein [Dehalogenimonas etheniformans]PPD57639.1 DUF72 domain-containing protein [Dehalogenimonas etheniformans]QNT75980.1 DUF72 domain-containing protein [Dehalogenimonas etheniformans]
MAQYCIGTSGWSYPRGEGTWNGYFYPPGTKNELGFYSQFFGCVEINSSFYSPINPSWAESWVRKTPDDFIFTAKLWQKFTHPKMFEAATGEAAAISRDDVDLYLKGIEPIARAGKLGAILAQFPPSFENGALGRQILEAVLRTFRDYPMAVELRHKSWSDDPTTATLLSTYDVAWVQIDEPKFSFSIARDLPATSTKLAYFRFHGRNAADWWTGNNETRYRYLYPPEEIEELTERVKKSATTAKQTFALFNNHWKAYAPRNAGDLIRSLDLPFQGLPTMNLNED